MKYTNLLAAWVVAVTFQVETQAASGKGNGANATVAEAGTTAASTRIRLLGKLQEGDLDLTEGQEISAKFQSRDTRRRLKLEVEGFSETKFTASIKIGNANHMLGDLVADPDEPGVLELDFREDSWLVGLPMDIPAGSVVTFMSATKTYQVTLQPK